MSLAVENVRVVAASPLTVELAAVSLAEAADRMAEGEAGVEGEDHQKSFAIGEEDDW